MGVLAALHIKDGQNVTALAASTFIEVSNISQLIYSMEAEGVVEKRREKPGMHSVAVHLTGTVYANS